MPNLVSGSTISYIFIEKGEKWMFQFSYVTQSCLFATPWTVARHASLSITSSWSLLKLMSFELVMPSKHLIICRLLLLPPSIFPSIRAFSNKSVLCTTWPKYWSFSFSISPSNEYSGLISFRINWLDRHALHFIQAFAAHFKNVLHVDSYSILQTFCNFTGKILFQNS